jgi:hypothetical protein
VDITTELNLGGTWTDISADVRTESDMNGTRGLSSWASEADPSKYVFALNNRHGKYSPRNPLSPYYRQLSRNTPIRISMPGTTSHLEILDDTGTVTTPHRDALNIAGDLDVRVEFDATLTSATANQTIIGKWSSVTAEKQWMLSVYNGFLRFRFITAAGLEVQAFQNIFSYGGKVLRVTLDADNGEGGWRAQFWQADEWGGPWTSVSGLLGTSGTGVKSVTAGPLAIGINDPTGSPARTPFIGYGRRFQVRRGIKGLVVADVDFTSVAAGATSFTDGAGNVWTLSGGAQVASRNYRFHGEVSEWPAETDDSDTDSIVRITAMSLKRRLDSGRDPLQSVLARRVPGYSPRAYWPLEEGADASQAYSPIDGVKPMTALNMTFASESTLPSASALPVVATQNGAVTSRLSGQVPAGGSTTGWSVYWLYRLNSQPSELASYMSIETTGTVRGWRVQVKDTGTRIMGYNSDGVAVVSQLIATGSDLFNQWVLVHFYGQQNGGNVSWRIDWQDIGGDAGGFGDTYAGTLGRVTSVGSPPNGWHQQMDGLALGHISVWDAISTEAYDSPSTASNVLLGYAGEFTSDRITRVARENDVPLAWRGKRYAGERVGPQPVDTFLTAVREATDADGGILLDQRARNAFLYLSPSALQNQTPKVTLDYTAPGHVIGTFKPVDDDQALENDSTVQREGGSSGRYEKTEGSLNVNPPEADEDGVGRYAKQVTLSVYSDEQCEGLAAWRVHLGTWDEARFPTLTVDARAIVDHVPEVAQLDVGDVIKLTNVPTQYSFNDLYLLVQGYSEVLSQFRWEITFNCVPYGPWMTAVVGEARADTTGSTLAAPAMATATTLQVVNEGALWARSADYPGDFPMDILVDGERMTLTAVTGAVEDAFAGTTAGGWDSADTGQAWQTSGGTAADYQVGSGYGSHRLATANVSRRSFLDFTHTDFDAYVSLAASSTATGGFLSGSLTGRYTDSNNLYAARLAFNTTSSMTLTLRKRVAGTETELGTYSAGSYSAGAYYRMRFQAAGSQLRAKVWPAGSREPAEWQVDVTDTSLTSSTYIGVRSISASSNTNTNPEIRHQDLRVSSPQTFTVVRSVNGVVKAQPVGARVSLFQMPFTALTE